MRMPCANPINCPGPDEVTINTSAEEPDRLLFFGYGFFRHSSNFCAEANQEIADICANNARPGNPPVPTIFSSNAKSCTVDCGDGTQSSYTVVAGTFVGLSQEEADTRAESFACTLAQLQCAGGVTVFASAAQSCSVVCANGSAVTYQAAAGLFSGTSQIEADAAAHAFACQVATILCGNAGPGPGGVGPGGGGIGGPPTGPNGTPQPLYGNIAQTCTVSCAIGGSATFTVQSGVFKAESVYVANAIAYSYACKKANEALVCISDLTTEGCVGEFYSQILSATGLTAPTWTLSGGSLPPGVELADDLLIGTPTASGSYSFSLTAASGVQSATRSYVVKVMEITTSALANATEDDPYSVALESAGNNGPVSWGIVSGNLPDGLTLHPATGVISGTPTTSGESAFKVAITDSDGQICTKDFTLEVESAGSFIWWKLDELAAPWIDSISGSQLDVISGTPTVVPAKILNGVRCAPPGVFFPVSIGSPAQDPNLSFTGAFSFCGWFSIDSMGASDFMSITFQDSAENVVWFLNSRPDGQFDFGCIGDTIVHPFVAPIGTFVFWHVYYEPVFNKLGIRFNNTFISETDACTITPSPSGRFYMAASITPGLLVVRYDETGFFRKKLSEAELADIYNGGAGRTFP